MTISEYDWHEVQSTQAGANLDCREHLIALIKYLIDRCGSGHVVIDRHELSQAKQLGLRELRSKDVIELRVV